MASGGRPDYVLILPWNLWAEIVGKMSAVCNWGGQFVLPIPTVEIVRPLTAATL